MENLRPEQLNAIVEEVVRRVTIVLEQQSVPLADAAPVTCPAVSPLPSPSAPTEQDVVATSREMIRQGAERIVCVGGDKFQCEDLARYIDHTLLKPNATEKDIERLCAEALQYHFASVCVNSAYVELCSRLLAGSGAAVP